VRVGEEGEKDCKSDSHKARRCQFPLCQRKGHGPDKEKGPGLYTFKICVLITIDSIVPMK